MQPSDITMLVLRYPNGWDASWAIDPAATHESLITCAMQLLELAGCDVTYHVTIPDGAVPLLSTQLEGLIHKLRHSGIAPSDEATGEIAQVDSDAPESVSLGETPAQPTAEDFSTAAVQAPPAPAPPKKPPPRRDRPKPVDEPHPPAA
jgi:hypothetical protein